MGNFWDFNSGGIPTGLTARTNGNGTATVAGGLLTLDTGGSAATDCAAVVYDTAIDLNEITVVAFSCSVTGPTMGAHSMNICGLYDSASLPDIMSNSARTSAEVIWLEDQYSTTTNYERWMLKYRNSSGTTYNAWTDEAWHTGFAITIRQMDRDNQFVVVMVIDGPNSRVRWDFLNRVFTGEQGYRISYSSEWATFGTGTTECDPVDNTAYIVFGDLVNDKSAGYDIQYEFDWIMVGEVSNADHYAWSNASVSLTYPFPYDIYGYVNPCPNDIALWFPLERNPSGDGVPENPEISRGSNDWAKDPCVYDNTADDGKYYMAYQVKASGGDGSIYIAEATSPLGPWTGATQVVATGTGEAKAEFPYLTRKSTTGDWVLFYDVEFDTGPTWKIYVRTSSNSTPYSGWSSATELLDTTGSGEYDDEGTAQPIPIWWSGTFDAGTWILYYGGCEYTGGQYRWSIHYAVSTTGFNGTYTKGVSGPQLDWGDGYSSAINGTMTETKSITVDSTTGLTAGDVVVINSDPEVLFVESVDSGTTFSTGYAVTLSDNQTVTHLNFASVSPRALRKIGGVWHMYVTAFKFAGGEEQSAVYVDSSAASDPRDATWRQVRKTDTPMAFTFPLSGTAPSEENIGFASAVIEVQGGTGQSVTPDAISSSTTVYSPTVTPGSVTIAPDSISSITTVHEPTLTPGAVTVAPDDIASTTTVHEPTITPGGVAIAPDAIASITTVYDPTVVAEGGPQSITPDAVASVTTVYSPTVTPGSIAIAPDAISSTTAVYDPTLGMIIALDAIASITALYEPTLTPGAISIEPDAIASVTVVYEPIVSNGAGQTIVPDSIASITTVHDITIWAIALARIRRIEAESRTFAVIEEDRTIVIT